MSALADAQGVTNRSGLALSGKSIEEQPSSSPSWVDLGRSGRLPLLGWVVIVFCPSLNLFRIADQVRLRKAHKEPFVAQANVFLPAVDAFNATIVDPSSVNS